ncbi:HAL protein kinase [Fusarium oxysporum f. sp. vasinfectum 25433]|uniref:non-specific serine/threonine protein kinase n=1 Tax=Fusarium oxysporum f. sp. vasinfectum 25433 TaxID=1089449 RepID=X0M059_FUSOX|nr:HAL protein kinase [Fusarium oxysporum f. sp. vasinfectum 25433]
MPLQGLAVLPEPQDGHKHHLSSRHTKRRALRMWSDLWSIFREQARMPLLVSNTWNSTKQNPVQLTSEKQGWRDSSATLVEKYGKCREVAGRGKFGIVFVSCKKKDDGAGEELYAVKKFQRQPKETERMRIRRSTAEFCVSSTLLHPNVIGTFDLLKDAKGNYCEVMEFSSGGELHSLLRLVGKLKWQETDCFFKQMMRGVEYIHEMGVAHLDLKPKHLLLAGDGVLKVSGFGHSECVRLAWERNIHMVSGIRGEGPYIAPEEYTNERFNSHAVDIWACGIIYMAMITGCPLWRTAKKSKDVSYARNLKERRQQEGFAPIESLHRSYGIEVTPSDDDASSCPFPSS